jgi:hypothetical protein
VFLADAEAFERFERFPANGGEGLAAVSAQVQVGGDESGLTADDLADELLEAFSKRLLLLGSTSNS